VREPIPWPIRIPLAADRWRLAVLVLVRAAVGGLGLWTGLGTPGPLGALVATVGAVVLLYAIFLLAWLATVRVEVWPRRIEVGWVLRRHRFALASGNITSLRPTRRGPTRLLAPFNSFGLQFGPARVGSRERLSVIHLAHRASLITVPTTEGRLAIAPADVRQLVVALIAATRP
jgi:hypothetical protein